MPDQAVPDQDNAPAASSTPATATPAATAPAASATSTASPASPASPASAATPPRAYVEDKPPRGLYVRVFIYVVATHVLLAFMSLLVIIAKTR